MSFRVHVVNGADREQVIILGDSGVGKTSLMNQYVRQADRNVSTFFPCHG
jgi:GTPase SAR1 family protein